MTYTGDSVLSVSLSVETSKPLDSRSVVDNLQDLYSIPETYAYKGMTVANIDNGNIYMLLDKSKIYKKEGWKASYESLQIISCSLEEYDILANNTTIDGKPIDETKDYLHSETYYYIYENDEGQYYLSSAWGKQIEELLSKKASNDAVVNLLIKVNTDIENLSTNYATSELINDAFLTKVDANTIYPIKLIVEDLETLVKEDYVTKESLKGDDPGDEDFIFVTLKKYNADVEAGKKEINTKVINTNESSTALLTIYKNDELARVSEVRLTSENNKVLANTKPLALEEIVPKVEYMDLPTYDDLVDNNATKDDTYYFTFGEISLIDTGYVSSELLAKEYYNKEEVKLLILDAIVPLIERLIVLETPII